MCVVTQFISSFLKALLLLAGEERGGDVGPIF
jgi:hypothetical protein